MSIRRFLIGALATVAMLAAMVGSAAACTATVAAGDCGKVHITVEGAAHWKIVLTGESGAGVYTFRLDGNVTVDEPVAPGTYHWSSYYTNDGPHWTLAQSGHVIVRACPTIATTLSGSSVAIGTAVHDSATLSGATANAGGSVSYTVYTDNECTAGARDAGTVDVTNGSVPDSNAITFTSAGTWYWQAAYSGDANNKGATSACTSETLTVGQNSPTIATTLSGSSVAIGTAVHDSATLSGATANAGGSVSYTVYTDNECTAGARDAGTVDVTNGSVPDSNAITFTSAGTWYWQAAYSGDANNKGATSACTSEILVVSPSPVESFQGETATPVVTSSPVESLQGETATPVRTHTPPPTSTGSDPSGNSSTPLFAMLICLAFGGLGLAAVEAQRRAIRS